MPKCAHCPLAGSTKDCPAVANPAPRLCVLADPAHPDHHPGAATAILKMAGEVPPVSPIGETPEPGLLQKAASLAAAAAQHVAAGMPTVDDAEKGRRQDICRSCEHFDAARVVCRRCGCGMNVKARWLGSKCPIDRW